ncbi:MAG: tRNA (N6-threonylcarbamoyladenosine(37)-N6)-methyltransferase TrmO [Candidatus Thorarchaeota archaeon]|nr:MAG: tRNA (N6-threonylcarbamoyladenosine(37)-N6)-methyltransferase TrmO [Candidatus Thorarchaeota archaeon]
MSSSDIIEIRPVAVVKRESANENERDPTIVSKIVFSEEMTDGLTGIEDFSHIHVIFWMHQVNDSDKTLIHPGGPSDEPVGIFATRAPIHPNPIGQTVVEVVKRDKNTLWVRGLDAIDDTPVLDIKPYPDWGDGRFKIVQDFRVPNWLRELIEE